MNFNVSMYFASGEGPGGVQGGCSPPGKVFDQVVRNFSGHPEAFKKLAPNKAHIEILYSCFALSSLP